MGNHGDIVGRGSGDRECSDASRPLEQAIRDALDAYRGLDASLAEAGGIGPVVALYERIRTRLTGVEYAELDRVAGEIRGAVEQLLAMDAAVRKLNNLKLLFDREDRTSGHGTR